jgi:hypothetical protein
MAETNKSATGISEAIREVAAGPASASNDAGSITQQNLKDLIEAEKFLSSAAASRRRGFGIKVSRIVPPGAC